MFFFCYLSYKPTISGLQQSLEEHLEQYWQPLPTRATSVCLLQQLLNWYSLPFISVLLNPACINVNACLQVGLFYKKWENRMNIILELTLFTSHVMAQYLLSSPLPPLSSFFSFPPPSLPSQYLDIYISVYLYLCVST